MLSERRTDLARLVGQAIGFLFDEIRISIHPCCGPVLDLDDPDSRRADSDDVDFVD